MNILRRTKQLAKLKHLKCRCSAILSSKCQRSHRFNFFALEFFLRTCEMHLCGNSPSPNLRIFFFKLYVNRNPADILKSGAPLQLPADYRQLDTACATGLLTEGPPVTLLNALAACPGSAIYSLVQILLRLCTLSECLIWTRA